MPANLPPLTADGIKISLWLSVPFNIFGAALLMFPGSAIGQLAGLPAAAPLLYRCLISGVVLMFAGVYAWLALQNRIQRPLLAVGAAGKTLVFATALILWLLDASTGALVLVVIPDGLFALLWAHFLISETDSRFAERGVLS